MRVITFSAILLAAWAMACDYGAPSTKTPMPVSEFDLQGHRGWRGRFPENTVQGFLEAMSLGVQTLEMDVVISKDRQVLLSHEPWLSAEICLTAGGLPVAPGREKDYNLYEMDYAAIRACDCGSRPHPRFPHQRAQPAFKPLLAEVIDAAERHAIENNLPKPFYNIETKCDPRGDGVFHPDPETFFDLVWAVLAEKKITDRVILQSFDVRTLQQARKKQPGLALALLVENKDGVRANLDRLGFTPPVYSPEWDLLDAQAVVEIRKAGMRLIPWTVNRPEDIRRVLALGVDGIISDYPERVLALRNGEQLAPPLSEKLLPYMNIHHVLFWLNPGIDTAGFRQALEKLGEISLVQQVHVGVPVQSDRPVVDGSYDFSLLLLFANGADEKAYQDDPDHHAFIEQWKHAWKRVQVYDASPSGQ